MGKKMAKKEKTGFAAQEVQAGEWVVIGWDGPRNYVAVRPSMKKGRAVKIARALNRVVALETKPPRKSPGRHARTKGHSFEREVAIALRGVFPEAKRHLEYQGSEANGVDIDGTGEYKFQCKKLKGYAPLNMINEIQCDEALGDVPILVTAADGKPAMAVLPFSDLIRLLGKDSFTG